MSAGGVEPPLPPSLLFVLMNENTLGRKVLSDDDVQFLYLYNSRLNSWGRHPRREKELKKRGERGLSSRLECNGYKKKKVHSNTVYVVGRSRTPLPQADFVWRKNWAHFGEEVPSDDDVRLPKSRDVHSGSLLGARRFERNDPAQQQPGQQFSFEASPLGSGGTGGGTRFSFVVSKREREEMRMNSRMNGLSDSGEQIQM
ncbi:hypothetical protein C8R45DRAFT_928019 [Mycena sanguinolenta]|nr:hypothetical protein C8R45DRAFT_928019 [Mycena sanguinolenta]